MFLRFSFGIAWHLRLRQYYPDQEVLNEHTDPILAETPHYKEKQTILPNPVSAEHHNEKKHHTPLKRTHDGKVKKEIKKEAVQPPTIVVNSPSKPVKDEAKIDMRKLIIDPKPPKVSSSSSSSVSSGAIEGDSTSNVIAANVSTITSTSTSTIASASGHKLQAPSSTPSSLHHHHSSKDRHEKHKSSSDHHHRSHSSSKSSSKRHRDDASRKSSLSSSHSSSDKSKSSGHSSSSDRPKESKESREGRDSRDGRNKESRDSKESKELKDSRNEERTESKETRTPKECKDVRESKHHRDSKEKKESKDPTTLVAITDNDTRRELDANERIHVEEAAEVVTEIPEVIQTTNDEPLIIADQHYASVEADVINEVSHTPPTPILLNEPKEHMEINAIPDTPASPTEIETPLSPSPPPMSSSFLPMHHIPLSHHNPAHSHLPFLPQMSQFISIPHNDTILPPLPPTEAPVDIIIPPPPPPPPEDDDQTPHHSSLATESKSSSATKSIGIPQKPRKHSSQNKSSSSSSDLLSSIMASMDSPQTSKNSSIY